MGTKYLNGMRILSNQWFFRIMTTNTHHLVGWSRGEEKGARRKPFDFESPEAKLNPLSDSKIHSTQIQFEVELHSYFLTGRTMYSVCDSSFSSRLICGQALLVFYL
jgi:hypothetical protein